MCFCVCVKWVSVLGSGALRLVSARSPGRKGCVHGMPILLPGGGVMETLDASSVCSKVERLTGGGGSRAFLLTNEFNLILWGHLHHRESR